MKTIELKLYEFSELSEDAQQNAISNLDTDNHAEYLAHEVKDTLDAFCAIFPIKWISFDIANCDYSVKFTGEDEHKNLTGIRLLKHLENNYFPQLRKGNYRTYKGNSKHLCIKYTKLNNGNTYGAFYSRIFFNYECSLTGMCFDSYILDTLLQFRNNPKNVDFEELLTDCVFNLLKGVRIDLEYYESEEFKREELIQLDNLYTEDGEQYNA